MNSEEKILVTLLAMFFTVVVLFMLLPGSEDKCADRCGSAGYSYLPNPPTCKCGP